jgi:hypothetical protein
LHGEEALLDELYEERGLVVRSKVQAPTEVLSINDNRRVLALELEDVWREFEAHGLQIVEDKKELIRVVGVVDVDARESLRAFILVGMQNAHQLLARKRPRFVKNLVLDLGFFNQPLNFVTDCGAEALNEFGSELHVTP